MAVYTLELEDGHYYVGYTESICTRVAQHWVGRGGSQWTQLHRPVRVLDVIPGGPELEDPTTIAVMARKGWRCVRGGSWSSPHLTAMPLPLAKAYCWDHLEVPERETPASYDFADHAVQVDRCKGRWRARVTGPRAVQAVKRCVKTFWGETEEDARRRAERWLG